MRADEQMQREFRRLGLAAECRVISPSIVEVTVAGWPDAIGYCPEIALPLLRSLPDGQAATAAGDAKMCEMLDAHAARVAMCCVGDKFGGGSRESVPPLAPVCVDAK